MRSMNHARQACRAALAAALLLLFFGHAGAEPGKTLTRTKDPVVVSGASVTAALGVPATNLALFACAERAVPIPFQIDERRDGGYVLTDGPEAGVDLDRGRLDADDEIAFISADLGRRCGREELPQVFVSMTEITITDPLDGGEGFAYLVAYDRIAPRSPVDYVVLNAAKNVIETTDYVVGYNPDAPISINLLKVPRSAGGSGQSVADRQKVRAHATSAWNLVHISKNADDFQAEVLAYSDGPVRVIRRTRNWVNLIWRIPSPSVELTSMYWKTGMSFPLEIRMPFNISAFFRDVGMTIYVDTPPDVPGRVFYNRHNRGGVLIDGRTSQAERDLDRRPSDWQVVAGTTPAHPEGWFSRQVFNAAQVPVRLPLFYVDDAATPDPPERFPGCFGCLGFELAGLQDIPAGSYRIQVEMFPLIDFRPGDEAAFLQITDAPLSVTAKPLANR
jgi:hypothetical protein